MKFATIAVITAVLSRAACGLTSTLSTSDYDLRHAVANGRAGYASKKDLRPIIDFYVAVNEKGLSGALLETKLSVRIGEYGLAVAVGEIDDIAYENNIELVGVTFPYQLIKGSELDK